MTLQDAQTQYLAAIQAYKRAAKWEDETEQVALKARQAAHKAKESMERAQGELEKLVMLEDDGR